MQMRKISLWWGVLICLLVISACWPFGKKKEEEQLYKEGKEGRWVYSERRPSPTGDAKKAVTYSKRPYGTQEGKSEDAAQAQPIVTPYLLGRLKYKVVVVEFQDETRKGRKGLGAIIAQELARQLEETGVVVLVDMELVKRSLGGADFNALTEPSSLWRLRTLLGVHGLVTGAIKDVFVGTGEKGKGDAALALTKIETKLRDTETGNVIRSIKGENPIYTSHAEGTFSREKALLKAIDFSLQRIKGAIVRGMSGIEWSTSVASVEQDKVYLNAGKPSGLKIGDVLEVYGPGKEVKHPITDVSLGRIPGELKGRIKLVRFFGVDAAETAMISGGDVASGDLVRLAK